MCILLSKSCGFFLFFIDVNNIRFFIEILVIRCGINVYVWNKGFFVYKLIINRECWVKDMVNNIIDKRIWYIWVGIFCVGYFFRFYRMIFFY